MLPKPGAQGFGRGLGRRQVTIAPQQSTTPFLTSQDAEGPPFGDLWPVSVTSTGKEIPYGSCQWHSEILQSCARLRLHSARRRRQGRLRARVRSRAERRASPQRGRQGLLRDRG